MEIAGGAAVVVVVAAVVAISNVGDDPVDAIPPATEQIDVAVVERDTGSDPEVRRPTYLIIQDAIDAAVAERVAADLTRSRAQVGQDEIDAGRAELDEDATEESRRPAYLMIQDAIDAAVEERKARQAETVSG